MKTKTKLKFIKRITVFCRFIVQKTQNKHNIKSSWFLCVFQNAVIGKIILCLLVWLVSQTIVSSQKTPPPPPPAGEPIIIYLRQLQDTTLSKYLTKRVREWNIEYKIKVAIMKSYVIGYCMVRQKNKELDHYFTQDFILNPYKVSVPFFFLQYPGFGYKYNLLDMDINPVDSLEIPGKNWQFYEVTYRETDHNYTVACWDNYKYTPQRTAEREFFTAPGSLFVPLISKQKILVALDEKEQVKLINGTGLIHALSQYFSITPEDPDSYVPFLKVKLYTNRPDTVRFVGEQEGNFVYEINSTFQIGLNPANPDVLGPKKMIKRESGDTPANFPYEKFKKDLGFPNWHVKQDYLRDALTKNLYMYRILHTDSLSQKLGMDTTTTFLNEGPNIFDQLIPNYDAYMMNLYHLVYPYYYCTKEAYHAYHKRDTNDFGYYITYNRSDTMSVIIAEIKLSRDIEFYKFYKDTIEIFAINRYHDYGQYYDPGEPWAYDEARGIWFHYDFFNFPHLRQLVAQDKPYPHQYRLLDVAEEWQESRKLTQRVVYCPPETPPSPYGIVKRPVDYYLLALDVKTREVYFISGKGIYLSKAAALYIKPKQDTDVFPYRYTELPAWTVYEKLQYIKDRLYQYQVAQVSEENIIESDEEKMVLKLQGEEYGVPLRLKVVFYNKRPEVLDIEQVK